ncbi:DNA topoisomerase IB [Leptolyngbya sp. NIES-2104]|uniref:DNA topoisomerase IB n=1 Tax=Leptolyngbya sp. NIES-2104 TaxID=1552121 RepID=UPI0006ECA3BD|nr:DNA topoisomerase IB [Leptolyngbya sp. NIES-2104]GAP98578.1 DNA topoisomerase IB [Leptolyngbya sp. NIES-2104]
MNLAVEELPIEIPSDPIESAEAVGLQYVSDEMPGIQRKRSGKSFLYFAPNGDRIKDEKTIQRINSLAIPPAYQKVWICPLENGHLQATGRDAKGRKQYRYHPLWRSMRDQTKFSRMIAFSQALPEIRRRIEHDLALPGLPKQKVLATILKLMELTRIRVGNEEYAKTNDSYGLTTLHDDHVNVSGSKVHFEFRGKSGVDHAIDIKDKQLAKIVKRCQDLPGQELFQYLDENKQPQDIKSNDVNDYLKEITEQDFTAKDFRTWSGTVLAASHLAEIGKFTSQTAAKKNVTQAVKTVSSYLGNRPATCKKYYIHPNVLEAYLDESLHDIAEKHSSIVIDDCHALRVEELIVVALLTETADDSN